MMGWSLQDVIQNFRSFSPNQGANPIQEIPQLSLSDDLTDEEEETLVKSIVDSPPLLPVCLRSDTPFPKIASQPDTPLSAHLEQDLQLMETLVAEELGVGAPPEQSSKLLVRLIHETTLQLGQEILCSAAERDQTPPPPPVYTRPLSYAPQSPFPEDDHRPVPYMNPGPDWVVNLTNEGITHNIRIPTDKHSKEEEIALFFCYDFTTDSPELLLTRGCNSRVHPCPLYARPQPYQVPCFSKWERLLFHHGQPFMPIMDAALDQERDVTLRAEVHHFRRLTSQVKDKAAHLALIRQEFNKTQQAAEESLGRLAQADVISRLEDLIMIDIPNSGILPAMIIDDGLQTLQN